MKFINYLESISGISVFPMISLLVFFAFLHAAFCKGILSEQKHHQ
jgi:hypothetical protein